MSYTRNSKKLFAPQESSEKSIQSIYNENNPEKRGNVRGDQQKRYSDRKQAGPTTR